MAWGQSAVNESNPRPQRVLIVEDDPRLLLAISDVLSDEGYETRTASNGRAAIRRLASGYSPDVIVLDLKRCHSGAASKSWAGCSKRAFTSHPLPDGP